MQAQNKFYQPPYLFLDKYDNIQQIYDYFPALKNVNKSYSPESFNYGKFYVIRSKKLDDVHKSVKYGIWTSSKYNNIKFNQNFKNTNGEVYFLFTCLTTDYFVGMAKMVYPNELDMEFAYWGEIGKWRGLMLV